MGGGAGGLDRRTLARLARLARLAKGAVRQKVDGYF